MLQQPADILIAVILPLHQAVPVLKQLTGNMLSEEFAVEVRFIHVMAVVGQPAAKLALMDARLIRVLMIHAKLLLHPLLPRQQNRLAMLLLQTVLLVLLLPPTLAELPAVRKPAHIQHITAAPTAMQ